MANSEHLTCRKCGTENLSADDFRVEKKTGRRRSECRNCERALTRKMYWADPVAGAAKRREWYHQHHEKSLAAMREYRKKYLKENKERLSETKKRKYHEDVLASRARVRTGTIRHKTNKPELYRETAKLARGRRRARLLGAPGDGWTVAEWLAKKEEFNHSCAYCGATGVKLEADHIVSLVRGGAHTIENIAPACRTCNPSKGAKPLEEWKPGFVLKPPSKRAA